ncbi:MULTISPECIES: hypothetical protein [unclassified Clostridium]|uniref:hypothetical protein n=1 Tax=unclassified Clostridium TaxID=2614128 RepID=UPI0002976815|nr:MULTISPECIES: hypothetical protein [unclassified Clostridium]EKQ51787.1 MAG: hypothetical protein A370_04536 [Clostridium sp. Maddingley MBC34-26]
MYLQYKNKYSQYERDDFMNDENILNEIMINVKQVPLECQERILDILKGMVFTKKCLTKYTTIAKEEDKNE